MVSDDRGGHGGGNAPALNPQQQRRQRRLYVGNLPPTATDVELIDFFNTIMVNSGAVTQKGNPVVSATINREKGFAFIEFRTAEEASVGMSLDGISLRNHALRVRRPDGDQKPNSGGPVSVDSPHKVYIGGISLALSEATITDLIQLFGPLKTFNLVRDSLTSQSKGFAFCEYQDPNVTDTACKILNGLELGGKTLTVQRANANAKAILEHEVKVDPRAAAMLTLSTPANQLLAAAIERGDPVPTRILVLCNIINITDFPGDKIEAEYMEMVNDIRSECEKFGRVLNIVVPRPAKKIIHDSVEHFTFDDYRQGQISSDDSSDDDAAAQVPGLGKVFVEYDDASATELACSTMRGRTYDGRMVICTYHSEEKWAKGDLEPDVLDDEYFPQVFENVAEKIRQLQARATVEVQEQPLDEDGGVKLEVKEEIQLGIGCSGVSLISLTISNGIEKEPATEASA